MLEHLKPLAVDPILTLMLECQADPNPEKVDLGAGVYKDETGNTPIMQAVQTAQARWQQSETTKTYVGPAGWAGFNQAMTSLLLGANHPAIKEERVVCVQTPGGCGALSMIGHLIQRCYSAAGKASRVWVSTPTWANHIPLLGECGLELKEYAYYDYQTHTIDFAAMMDSLANIEAGDVVLLHGCCHNPSGADLNHDQWQQVAILLNEKGALPLIDVAYQGLGDGLDEDVWGLRHLAEHCPELMIASSCSKNFGLYRERVGAAMIIAKSPSAMEASRSQLLSIARGIYSMPPNLGGALVDIILNDPALTTQWHTELDAMRQRITDLRSQFVATLQAAGAGSRFDYIEQEKGMFSFLGISPEQVKQLKEQYSIYMVSSSRVNVAGLSDHNMGYIVDSLIKVLR